MRLAQIRSKPTVRNPPAEKGDMKQMRDALVCGMGWAEPYVVDEFKLIDMLEMVGRMINAFGMSRSGGGVGSCTGSRNRRDNTLSDDKTRSWAHIPIADNQ